MHSKLTSDILKLVTAESNVHNIYIYIYEITFLDAPEGSKTGEKHPVLRPEDQKASTENAIC